MVVEEGGAGDLVGGEARGADRARRTREPGTSPSTA